MHHDDVRLAVVRRAAGARPRDESDVGVQARAIGQRGAELRLDQALGLVAHLPRSSRSRTRPQPSSARSAPAPCRVAPRGHLTGSAAAGGAAQGAQFPGPEHARQPIGPPWRLNPEGPDGDPSAPPHTTRGRNTDMNDSILSRWGRRIGTWVTIAAVGGLLVGLLAGPALAGVLVPGRSATVVPGATDTPPEHTISVTGSGKVTVVPDMATISLGVVTEKSTAKAARDAAAAAMTKVVAAIKKLGIDDKDIQTSSVSLGPVYDYPQNATPKIRGYQLQNIVTVTVRKLDVMSDVLDDAVTAGASSVNGISFDVADRAAAEATPARPRSRTRGPRPTRSRRRQRPDHRRRVDERVGIDADLVRQGLRRGRRRPGRIDARDGRLDRRHDPGLGDLPHQLTNATRRRLGGAAADWARAGTARALFRVRESPG